MKHILSNSKCIFNFSKENVPVFKINSGDTVEISTLDCFANQVQTLADNLEEIDWDRINPATGPIYINDAMPGDVLKIQIEKIQIEDKAVIATGKDLGVLGDRIDKIESKILSIIDGKVIFDDKLSIPIDPMIGVIGVAPKDEKINCGTPGNHGGNMDNSMIRENATLYLPIFVEGALFALGDLHAAMGDGEICVSGAEVSGKVTVKLELIKNMKLNNPLVENNHIIATIASAETLDLSVEEAVSDMEILLSNQLKMPKHEIAMLLSLVGNVEVCQVVDPLKTSRFTMPKWVLDKYDFKI